MVYKKNNNEATKWVHLLNNASKEHGKLVNAEFKKKRFNFVIVISLFFLLKGCRTCERGHAVFLFSAAKGSLFCAPFSTSTESELSFPEL